MPSIALKLLSSMATRELLTDLVAQYQRASRQPVTSEAAGGVDVAKRVAGVILLNIEAWRSIVRIEDIIVGRLFRRYGIGTLLLNCAADWARNHGCHAILLETQNINYPAIRFYLRNGLEVWGISQHFYPPGPEEHEVAIFMGKMLR